MNKTRTKPLPEKPVAQDDAPKEESLAGLSRDELLILAVQYRTKLELFTHIIRERRNPAVESD